jgi:hypothetical protein
VRGGANCTGHHHCRWRRRSRSTAPTRACTGWWCSCRCPSTWTRRSCWARSRPRRTWTASRRSRSGGSPWRGRGSRQGCPRCDCHCLPHCHGLPHCPHPLLLIVYIFSGCLIEAPWLVNGGHGASSKQAVRPLGSPVGGRGWWQVGAAVIELLERHGVALEGRRVAVLGRSNWVRPSGRSLGRRARILRASARAVDTHRDSIAPPGGGGAGCAQRGGAGRGCVACIPAAPTKALARRRPKNRRWVRVFAGGPAALADARAARRDGEPGIFILELAHFG